jgi:YjbE family integral membrane protein
MIEDFANAAFWLAIGKIAWIDLLLSGDNAIVIALAARNLPKESQRKAVILGGIGAIALRVALIFVAFRLLELPYVKLVGAALLVWIGVKLLVGEPVEKQIDPARNLIAAVRTILVADLVMSLDNVIALAAITETAPASSRLPVLLFGLALTVPLIMFGSTVLLKLIQRFPLIVTAGAALLGFVGGEMAADDPLLDPLLEHLGLDQDWLPMALGLVFAVIVVVIGTLLARAHRPAALID